MKLTYFKSILDKTTTTLRESIDKPSMELPDMPELDAKGIREALKLSEPDLKKLIASEDRENKVPTMIRQFLYDITGGEETLTEKDLLAPELEFLTSQALQGKTNLEYADYNTAGTGQSQYSDVGGGGGILDFFKKLNDHMEGTVNLVRTDLTPLQRCTIEAMIVLDVHARDTIKDDMIDVGEASHTSFAWLKQLRYYWEDNDVIVKIIIN